MTTTGRCNAVNQTDNERSREPIAKQQNLFLLESGRFRIDWWNRCEYRCESVWCVIKFYLPITVYAYVWMYCIYHAGDCLAMPNKIFITFPAITIDDLCGRPTAIHCVCWYEVLAIRWPWQSQHMRCAAAIFKWLGDGLLTAPVWRSPYSHTAIVTLWGEKFADLQRQQ